MDITKENITQIIDESIEKGFEKFKNENSLVDRTKVPGESKGNEAPAIRKELAEIGKKKQFGKEIAVVKATNIEGTDNLGGYLVPTEKGEFLFSINDFGLLRKQGTIVPMSRDKMDMPYASTELTAYNVNEAATATVSNYVFGNLQLDTQKYIAMSPMSSELLEDSYYPVETIVSNSFGIQFSGAEDSLFNTRINSVGNSYGTTGSATGSFTNTITGGDQFIASVLSPMVGGLAAVNTNFTEGAGFIMNPTVWYTILKWSDTTRRPITPFVDSVNKTLWGQPVYLSNKFTNATTTTAGKVIIAYGNLKNAYLGDRVQMQIDLFNQGTFGTTNAMESDLVVFRGRSRFDVQLRPDAFWVYRLG